MSASTLQSIRPSGRKRQPTNPECPAQTHLTLWAYQHRCRCPEAIAAHERHRRPVASRAALDDEGVCRATRHDTWRAYADVGCRCPLALAARDRRREGQHPSNKRESARQQRAAQARAEAQARSRLEAMRQGRVNPISVLLLATTAGDVSQLWAEATLRERQVAVMLLHRRLNGTGTAYLDGTQIALRLGLDRETVRRYRDDYRALPEATRRKLGARWGI